MVFRLATTPIRRPFSLSGCDEYPLVRVRPAEPQDVRAPHSKTIDRWIDIAKSNVDGPIWDINMPLRSLDYLLWEDKVECTLRVVEKEGDVEGPFKDPNEYALTLRVRVPPSAGFLVYYQRSPTITIDRYTGLGTDGQAPHWIESVGKELCFWQGRCLMVEMLLHIIEHFPASTRVASRVRSWCRDVSVPAVGDSTSIRPRKTVIASSPQNTRRHKLRPYDLSFEEAQGLRISSVFNSPLCRKT